MTDFWNKPRGFVFWLATCVMVEGLLALFVVLILWSMRLL